MSELTTKAIPTYRIDFVQMNNSFKVYGYPLDSKQALTVLQEWIVKKACYLQENALYHNRKVLFVYYEQDTATIVQSYTTPVTPWDNVPGLISAIEQWTTDEHRIAFRH